MGYSPTKLYYLAEEISVDAVVGRNLLHRDCIPSEIEAAAEAQPLEPTAGPSRPRLLPQLKVNAASVYPRADLDARLMIAWSKALGMPLNTCFAWRRFMDSFPRSSMRDTLRVLGAKRGGGSGRRRSRLL